ncbi:MAG TPA: hypothetical protein VFI89_06250, partial [Burkholderiales bacterium]|nr:hypothetical protein [Burkholderiales bacterium]
MRPLEQVRALLDNTLEELHRSRAGGGHGGVTLVRKNVNPSANKPVGLEVALENTEAAFAARAHVQDAELRHVPGCDPRERAHVARRGG